VPYPAQAAVGHIALDGATHNRAGLWGSSIGPVPSAKLLQNFASVPPGLFMGLLPCNPLRRQLNISVDERACAELPQWRRRTATPHPPMECSRSRRALRGRGASHDPNHRSSDRRQDLARSRDRRDSPRDSSMEALIEAVGLALLLITGHFPFVRWCRHLADGVTSASISERDAGGIRYADLYLRRTLVRDAVSTSPSISRLSSAKSDSR
jgi:hypothetical protein